MVFPTTREGTSTETDYPLEGVRRKGALLRRPVVSAESTVVSSEGTVKIVLESGLQDGWAPGKKEILPVHDPPVSAKLIVPGGQLV